MSLVAVTKGTKKDMEGSLSVLSIPGGTPGMFTGKGRSTTEMVVSRREERIEGELAGVVRTVTERRRRWRRRARLRMGMVWPCDMKGNRTKCLGETVPIL